jgi:hypothetical protein
MVWQLRQRAPRRLNRPNSTERTSLEEQTALLADAWMRAYRSGFIQLHVIPPRVANKEQGK